MWAKANPLRFRVAPIKVRVSPYPNQAPTMELKVTGMTCTGCVNSVRRAIERVAPHSNPQIELASGRVQIDDAHVTEAQTVAAMLSVIEAAGFAVEVTG